jgi:hypothetical protein
MGKGRKHARKRKELDGSDSDASLSDGELMEKKRMDEEAQDSAMKSRLDRIKAGYINKQKTLVLSSRGITHRYRHLMLDILQLLPHARKDSKLDTKQKLYVINEIADMKDCTNCIFFEVRKGTDLYLWFARVPNGPSIKFQVLNGTSQGGGRRDKGLPEPNSTASETSTGWHPREDLFQLVPMDQFQRIQPSHPSLNDPNPL